tara:strand:- start:3063 stop:3914 length:852 start_codon:yes stop_codon:yes gene_type:complete
MVAILDNGVSNEQLNSEMKKIVWIASYPKSGNTWIRSILANAIFEESDIRKLGKLIPSFPFVNQSVHPTTKELSHIGELMQAFERTQDWIVSKSGNNHSLVKTHNACGFIEGVKFPNDKCTAGSIYIVRDPRDVLVSLAAHNNTTFEETEKTMLDVNFCIARPGRPMNREFVSSWEHHIKGWQNFAQAPLIVRYEDLINETKPTITRIFDYLGIKNFKNFDDLMSKTSFQALQKQEEGGGFDEKMGAEMFFRSGKVGSWKDCDFDFSKITRAFESTMAFYNYI